MLVNKSSRSLTSCPWLLTTGVQLVHRWWSLGSSELTHTCVPRKAWANDTRNQMAVGKGHVALLKHCTKLGQQPSYVSKGCQQPSCDSHGRFLFLGAQAGMLHSAYHETSRAARVWPEWCATRLQRLKRITTGCLVVGHRYFKQVHAP